MYYTKMKSLRILSCTIFFLFLTIDCLNAQTLKCTRVVDGNTIILSNGETVKPIGVEAGKIKYPGKPVKDFRKEATAFINQMVKGKEVRLEYGQQKKDKYGQLLAYIYLKDGTFLNAEIIKQGYGHADTRFPFKYKEQFKQYEEEARVNKRGLWASKPAEKEIKYIREYYVGSKGSKSYHKPHCAITKTIPPVKRRTFNSLNDAVDAGYIPCKICKPPYID